MQKLLASLAFLLILYPVLAQEPITKEEWQKEPAIHPIDKKHETESAVIILDKRRMEYVDEGDNLVAYKTLHKIIRVNDDRGIESFNRVYLGVSNVNDIVDIRARTILPGGKVIELDRSNIKDLKDEDGSLYKIFAMEGMVKGCEIEYYYTYKRPATYFIREVMQTGVPVQDCSVEIISPKRLLFDTKIVNAAGIQNFLDTSGSKRIVRLQQKNIEGAEEEKYAHYTSNLQRVEFKLSYNLSRSNTERLFTWNELAKRLYESYATYSDKEQKRAKDFVQSNGWHKLNSERDKIIAVENTIKKNFMTREDIDSEDAEDVEKIIKSKIASYRGIVRLYGAVYKELGVNHQYVLAGNRKSFVVDRTFENWSNTEHPLLYFPTQRKFLAPTQLEMRFPWIEPSWGNTNGLFCKTTTIGNFTTAIGEIKNIPLEEYSQTVNNIDAEIKLNKSNDTLLVDIKQIYSGYAASVFRASFNYSSEEEQRNFLKQLVKFGTNSENITSSKIANKDFESYSENKPFVIQAAVKASELVEQAGNKILIKIGDVIGPQVEMYQEKARQFPMEIEFPHVLERKIKFIVPEGYTIKNPDELTINHTFNENGASTMGFVSSYKLEKNELTIHVMEEYKQVFYPLSQYEDFKRIINAAADFNKIVLVLEKK